MKLRHLGYRCQTLEAGPFTFLISDSLPVAYRDLSEGERYYRTDRFFSKGTTRHQNSWLSDKPVQVIPHNDIVAKFESLDRFTDQTERRQFSRRSLDNGVPEPVRELAEALAKVLKS